MPVTTTEHNFNLPAQREIKFFNINIVCKKCGAKVTAKIDDGSPEEAVIKAQQGILLGDTHRLRHKEGCGAAGSTNLKDYKVF